MTPLATSPTAASGTSLLLVHAKLVNRRRLVLLPGLQDGRRPVGLVGRVRVVLRLEAEAEVLLVNDAAFPCDRPVEEVAAVELNPRLSRVDLERATGLRL